MKMRGWTLFITDLVKCKDSKDEELKRINKELVNIRNKFNHFKPLNGYQKKKYICKLVYIFLLGYEFEFGLLEAITLLTSNVYSEKQLGYLFMSIVPGESYHQQLVINALKNDLTSSNSIFRNLALQFIANSSSVKLADTSAGLVINILLGSDATDTVKQSAVLTLLQILRIKPDFMLDKSQITRLIQLLSHHHLGLVTASANLIEFLTETFPEQCQCCVTHCIDRLSRIVTCTSTNFRDYSFYSVPAPWITIKLLRILKNLPPIYDNILRIKLREILQVILGNAGYAPITKSFEHNNIKYAIMLEAISLIIQTNFQGLLLSKSLCILEATLRHKEINFICEALEMMIQLTNNKMYIEHVKLRWDTVLNLLKTDLDITIKKRAGYLLYIICSENNVKPIVTEILKLLEYYRDNINIEEMLFQITSLVEQFGTDRQWHVDTILKLFQVYGDKMNDRVWHSLIKIVVDNENIRKYAAERSYHLLCEENCHDTIIKLAGYILGEFGYLIDLHPWSGHKKQFNVLKEKYSKCSMSTKALLLTTFMKFLNLYSDLKEEVLSILKDKSNIQNKNEEIQQRSIEYLKLSEIASKTLLATLLDEMPSNQGNVSTIVETTVQKKFPTLCLEERETSSKREKLKLFRSCSLRSVAEDPDEIKKHMVELKSHSKFKRASSSRNFNMLGDIFKDTMIVNTVKETSIVSFKLLDIPSNKSFLHNLLFNDEDRLYENDVIAIIITCDFKKHLGRFYLKYMNKTNNELPDFSVRGNFANVENKCLIDFKPIDSVMPAKGIIEHEIRLECLKEFAERPSLILKFMSEKQKSEFNLTLPLTLNKFFEPADMTPEIFAKRWKNFESISQEARKKFTAKYPMIRPVTREKLKGFGLSVIENGNSEPGNFECAGIFCTRKIPIGFLVRLEKYNFLNMYHSRVRSRESNLSCIVSNLLLELL